MFLNSLTGRFLLLTIVFVMLAEVMIFVPSVARFRQDYLQARLERGQLASLAVLANADQMVNPALKKELLENAGVMNVVLRRNEVRELVLSSPMPVAVEATYDLRDASPIVLIRDAVMILFDADDRVIRVIGTPVKKAGLQIEVTLHTTEMRTAMLDYGYSVFLLSLIISVITSALLFFAVRWFLVLPIRRVVGHITAFKDAPQDLAKIIEPSAGITELFQAEQALMAMQIELSKALKQKDRLAILGGAVAKISHDLRNMLTTAQLLADRMEMSKDPAVRRTTPKLVSSLSRAIKLCESTLKFGKAEEPSPVLVDFPLQPLVEDVVESESLPIEGDTISYALAIPDGMRVRADAEQIFRVLSNLIRNAQQAVVATKKPGTISVTATVDANFWSIEVRDTGPGLPTRAQAHLFEAFEGGARQGGSGLGLAIASELVRGHGGTLELVETNENGTCFRICLPIGKGPDLLPDL
ncbi:MAG: HAMP domain-containing histidine kinase [Rhodobacter sp.]|jgi:signal transduction histidine kinase|nr:HAMP domain-containing histidine kinase [Rhodobacter sp.]